MTEEQRALLRNSTDMVVRLKMVDGESLLAQVLFVFDEGETPDVFFLKVAPDQDGRFVRQEENGRSVLLSEIAGVYRVED